VLLDNLYCDGEVSVDGHAWSNSAIANDCRIWFAQYGGYSIRPPPPLSPLLPVWDVARKLGSPASANTPPA
jgi:hypothetical protein